MILLRLEFLQNLASYIISCLNSAIIHNLEKYYALKKVHYLSQMEDIKGDYLEFGVFTGSSFCHSIRCFKKLLKANPKISKTRFYGFDSFKGFGHLNQIDEHPYYRDENFITDLSKVEKRVHNVAGSVIEAKLIPGFFSESLKKGAKNIGINKAKIIFIDSDTFTSANQALSFCKTIVQIGTYIILDDYFSYRGRDDRGVRYAFSKFIIESRIKVRQIYTYGMGGVVFIISEIKQ